jgi:hypothetical protein
MKTELTEEMKNMLDDLLDEEILKSDVTIKNYMKERENSSIPVTVGFVDGIIEEQRRYISVLADLKDNFPNLWKKN